MRCNNILFNNEELALLKRPVGILIKDDEVNKDRIMQYIDNNLVISIGDATTDRLILLNIIPDIQIVDGRERRNIREAAGRYYKSEVSCINPAGSITYDAIQAFNSALILNKPVRVLVNGEEDLFGLIALAFAPINSMIFYGQPFEGIVALRVNEENRARFKSMIEPIIKLGNDDVAAV
ncbi:MAG: GTP-dependent dephospho-CoA kinase family protein [Candidatus Nitrosocaldaceae archaeon]